MSQMNEYKHSKLVVNVLDFIISLLSVKQEVLNSVVSSIEQVTSNRAVNLDLRDTLVDITK